MIGLANTASALACVALSVIESLVSSHVTKLWKNVDILVSDFVANLAHPYVENVILKLQRLCSVTKMNRMQGTFYINYVSCPKVMRKIFVQTRTATYWNETKTSV